MVKRKNALSSMPNIPLSGMVGSFVTCNADNDSWFCSITKFVSLIQMVIFLCIIVYLGYTFFMG
jgi:hypothetical protein